MNKYLASFHYRFKFLMAYMPGMFAYAAFALAIPVIMILVWTAIYANTGTSVIAGFTQQDMYAYYLIMAAIMYITSQNLAYDMQWDIVDGNAVITLIRPMNYIATMLSVGAAQGVSEILLIVIPIFVVTVLLFSIHVSLLLIGVLVLELAMAWAVSTAINITLGSLSAYFTRITGLVWMVTYVGYTIGGALLPLAIFPSSLAAPLSVLPFAYMYYFPAATLVGVVPLAALPGILLVGLAWIAALFALAYLAWTRLKRRISVVGV